MGLIKKLWARIRGVPRRVWVFSFAGAIVLLLAIVAGAYAWDYTNSPPFCGTTCHTMPPEYNAFLVSPHARVSCVECHIGRTFIGNAFTRKAGDLMHVIRYTSNNYTFPLYVRDMQPARESCEKCHWPEKFSNDKVVVVKHYATDAQNSLEQTALVMKTGGGTEREGRGKGIHWHIQQQIYYIATDPLAQNIPWIQVVDAGGKETIYTDVENPLTPDEVAKLPKKQMDCMDCHNRVSHHFQSPTEAVEEALSLKQLDVNMPSIRQKAVEVISAKYTTQDQAEAAISGLDAYYRQTYADYYQKNAATVKDAIGKLKKMYADLVFPTQDLSWTTHPDNLGHKDWPGCFRCHDGKHLTPDNKEAVRLECNLCHSLPQVVMGNVPVPAVAVAQADEPPSHLATTWLAQHRTAFTAACQVCHDTRNAGGKDNSSFCSNSACHGTKWTFAGLDAPALTKLLAPPVRPPSTGAVPKIPHPIGGNPDCQICHGPSSKVRPFPADHQGRTNDQCQLCHTPSIPVTAAPGAAAGPPQIPHALAGRSECLGCHASGIAGIPQVPQFHKDYQFPNTGCLNCHRAGEAGAAAPTPAPTARPTAAPTVAPTTAPPTTAPTVAAPTATAVPTTAAPATSPTGAATAAPTTSAPTTAPTTAATATLTSTPTVAATTAATGAPSGGAIPTLRPDHAGRTVCLVCHEQGVAGAPKLLPDHAGRTDATCTGCHK